MTFVSLVNPHSILNPLNPKFGLVLSYRSNSKRIRRAKSYEQWRKESSKKDPTSNRKWRPGTLALREIRHYQKSTDFLMPKRAFMRSVIFICDFYDQHIRCQKVQILRWNLFL